MNNLTGRTHRNLVVTTLTALVFFSETMLFRTFFDVMAVVGIRPSALPPVFGLMLGPHGVFGCAIGLLVADVITGEPLLGIALGCVANLSFGILPYLMWNAFDELNKRTLLPIGLSSVENVIRYIALIFINSIVNSVFVGSVMQIVGIGYIVQSSTIMLFLNNFVFCGYSVRI